VTNKQSGFTLVEISIVLVIIGLILGAVLYNSDLLIGNTKTTSTVKLITDLSGAVSNFKSRYHYLPGDLPQASSDITGITSGTACDKGNGNGLVDDPTNEIPCVATHLVLSGFIKGSTTGIISPFNGSTNPDVFVMAASLSAYNTAYVGTPSLQFPSTVQNVIEIQNIPCDAASGIDNKIDDGVSTSGNVRYTTCSNNLTTLDVGL